VDHFSGCLRSRSAASRLLGLWFRISPGHGYFSLVSVVCSQVDVFAAGRSAVHTSRTKCGVSECDHKASTMKWLRPIKAVEPLKKTRCNKTSYCCSRWYASYQWASNGLMERPRAAIKVSLNTSFQMLTYATTYTNHLNYDM
jgi:hypothetical protein